MLVRILILLLLLLCGWRVEAQWVGCTDPLALNYDPLANTNDGSCTYPPTAVSPEQSLVLPVALAETSGLIEWNGLLWTHNDDTDTNLYALDTQGGEVDQECALAGVVNQDWEDIDQDEQWIYIGDVGNNASGNRQDLHILRVDKSTLCTGQAKIDTIWFHYEDQTDFSNQGSNATDYDCEAMVVGQDSIYLFTKQWKSQATSVYSLPKVAGDHVARFRATWPVNGLVTGATWMEQERLLVLSGYSILLQPFMLLCYDFSGHSFFNGNKRRLDLMLPFHQVEGIATMDGMAYYLSNERFNQIVMVPPKLHRVDLSAFLGNYLGGGTPITPSPVASTRVSWQNGVLAINRTDPGEMTGSIVDILGRSIQQIRVAGCISQQEVHGLASGVYWLHLGQDVFPFQVH